MDNPTEPFKTAMENIASRIPLQCIDKCKYKKYPTLPRKVYEVDETKHLQDLDPDWSNFLQAQADSSAKYIYGMNFYGKANDPTLVRKDPFPVDLINQRLIHIPAFGPLTKDDIFYILSFILNLNTLCPNMQMEIMEYLQQLNLLNDETLTYMHIISRHPNTGLTDEEKSHFQYMIQELIKRRAIKECSVDNYFKPCHLFQKISLQMDPYELAYLKKIMEIETELTKSQYIYLTEFVLCLEEMPVEKRNMFMNLLYNWQIIPMSEFRFLLRYLHYKSLPYDTERLKLLFKTLEKLLNIEETIPEPIMEMPKEPVKIIHIEINVRRLQKALADLMKDDGIPNAIRLTDLRVFIKNIMTLSPKDLEMLFDTLKMSIDVKQLEFLKKYINEGKIAIPPKRLQLITDAIDKVLNPTLSDQQAQQPQPQPQPQPQRKSSLKHIKTKTSKVDIKSLLKETSNDIINKVEEESNLEVPFHVATKKSEEREECEGRELGGSDKPGKHYNIRKNISHIEHQNRAQKSVGYKLDNTFKHSNYDIISVNSKLAIKNKTKIEESNAKFEANEFKKPKIDYFIYPPPRRTGKGNEYLIDSPRGPIPLIRNRALWIHYPFRNKITNKIVSIQHGELIFK